MGYLLWPPPDELWLDPPPEEPPPEELPPEYPPPLLLRLYEPDELDELRLNEPESYEELRLYELPDVVRLAPDGTADLAVPTAGELLRTTVLPVDGRDPDAGWPAAGEDTLLVVLVLPDAAGALVDAD